MSGLSRGDPTPTEIILHQRTRRLEVAFSDQARFIFSFEMLRVYSPSAEVRGHGPGQEVLQTGKAEVLIHSLEPVGHYAVKPVFSDGHDTGIYSWDYLYFLGTNQERLWREYLERLADAKASRQPTESGTSTSPSASADPTITEVRRR
jgi:DUF971 family protein